jgi:hypothetical protein
LIANNFLVVGGIVMRLGGILDLYRYIHNIAL